ncbi:hypothetical protein RJ640_029688 [Escallonia rubra]|uniref:RING-type domain-containing protein n=1 Tax=Escallonia rubra TaxID=112253 RepID=A0AA88QS83_9ASTE|nr:hypothetical protein RJ640_029688 [Escallonia rubra]
MDNSKAGSDEAKTATEQSPNGNNPAAAPTVVVSGGDVVQEEESGAATADVSEENRPPTTRTPFTDLSQVDADLALARTLQEQERAYMMIRMNGDGSDYGSWGDGSYMHENEDDDDDDEEEEDDDDDDDGEGDDHFDDPSEDDFNGSDADENEEDGFDVHAHAEDEEDDSPGVELDPASFPSDEAYARALQDAEDREMAARLLALAGLNEMIEDDAEDADDQGDMSQETWDGVDPDEFSYEELLALGEVVGTESRGLSAATISSLPSMNYKMQDGNSDSCVICRLDYEDDDKLTLLSCKHSYHPECITNWLRINKVHAILCCYAFNTSFRI